MLSTREQELLAAYVDGELSAGEYRLVTRLLRRNARARSLLAQLQGDSRELQAMPALKAPFDLSGPVLERIASAPLPFVCRPRLIPPPPPGGFSIWRGLAAAAAVLLAIGMGSFFLHHSVRPTDTSDNTLAHNDNHSAPSIDAPAPQHEVVKDTANPPREKAPRLAANDSAKSRPVEDPPDLMPWPPIDLDMPDPDKPDERILASGGNDKPGQFERVELALPTIHKLHVLDQAEQAQKLLRQFATGQGFRIEITARDASRGFARVEQAFAGRKIGLVIDPTTAVRLKKPQWRTDLAVFVENISPDDLVDLLRAVGVADRQAAEKKPSEMRFDGSVVIREFSAWDRRELHDLLSIDPVKVRPTVPVSRGVDISRPLADQTADQVVAVLGGKGPARPGTTAPNLSCYVTSLSGPRGRSLDLKLFLESRRPARPGTLQVFLVLRNVAP